MKIPTTGRGVKLVSTLVGFLPNEETNCFSITLPGEPIVTIPVTRKHMLNTLLYVCSQNAKIRIAYRYDGISFTLIRLYE